MAVTVTVFPVSLGWLKVTNGQKNACIQNRGFPGLIVTVAAAEPAADVDGFHLGANESFSFAGLETTDFVWARALAASSKVAVVLG